MNIRPILSSLALAALTAAAQIYPVPQQLVQSGDAFTSAGAKFRLAGAETADADAVSTLNAALSTGSDGGILLTIGEAGDDAVSAVAAKIPARAQGYYLSVTPSEVVIAGRDGEGTYYGVQSLLQLLEQPTVPAVEVTDWPTTAVRGVIEGYYGNPWSHEDCLDMYKFFDLNKMNTFIYGPKNDAYHKAKWAEEYPADQAAALSELAREGLKHKVHFTWAMHPGNAIEGENMTKALAKFEKMYDLGIRRFAVFFDDISGNKVNEQVTYLNYLNREFVKKHSDIAPLIMCPQEYCISFAGGWNTSSTYLQTIGTGLDPDIEIMWTGSGVVDMSQKSAAEWFSGKTGRKPFIWLNYPVTDYGYEGGPLLMSPYQPAAADVSTVSTAFCSNPMEYYEASKIALFGIADFAWNPAKYNDWDNWNYITRRLMPDHEDAFRTYCYSNFYYPSNTHGLRVAYDETPEFTALQAENPNHSEAYNAYFDKQIATADELLALTDNRLISEIKEWIEVYRMQGERGLLLDSLRTDLEQSDGSAFVKHYTSFKALTDSAANHYSRAGWSVRQFLPKSAPQFVEPFVTAAAHAYGDRFREGNYDYPADLFDPQIIDNGYYYILYNGKLLSNGSGAAADTPANPTFRSDVDNINSARQSWKITFDHDTKRYSIHSAYDERYVNEIGNFGTNAYSNAWNTYEIFPLGDYYAIKNAGSGGKQFWTVTNNRLGKHANTAYDPSMFIFQIVPIEDEINPEPQAFTEGEYLIYNNEGQILRRSGNNLSFVDKPEKIQTAHKWTFSLDAEKKRYKISQGTAYLNEKGVIGTNQFYNDWNTYEIYTQGNRMAIRNAESAKTNFWLITEAGQISNDATDLIDSFNFGFEKFVPEEEEDAIEELPTTHSPLPTFYDLQGRRVVNPGKGIYIVNGKKITL
ncbi:MAG: beta-N-acetylglucosaminidase domain-containing protein [Bacteroides sp.]|nr:beta-N-acetylglucosaminidase domain-containing protein [Bacteroides sp.]MCM1379204.1 beta-N-acetylglucosaminidase domain-containing protein [Bacteroides sp.]MCM1445147.1 beta-N-acetylglucosaminidase domain-containing protein [Prevotella sp.]